LDYVKYILCVYMYIEIRLETLCKFQILLDLEHFMYKFVN